MSRFVGQFVMALLLWLAVTWTLEPANLVLGLLASGAAAWALRHVEPEEAPLLLLPHRLLWLLVYLPVLFVEIVKANFDVAYRVLHPALPIRPGIVRARTKLKSPSARVLLANSVTLTPGTP
ncbi:MAG: Na+/H+ antiporter subunit E, partial [Planctomycetes bacterium]|nr:Na+/H+ antiporter subunit E [Planctomycetota bacterium]